MIKNFARFEKLNFPHQEFLIVLFLKAKGRKLPLKDSDARFSRKACLGIGLQEIVCY
jgi:hypothetical protein